jgi:squalene-associated FAD-dependent desaturase
MTPSASPSFHPTVGLAPRVAIVGGGLAGLAAAVALVTRGCNVELFEARRKLGGRAGSHIDRTTGESIDHCQHVAMGCCTNFVDLCQRTGVADLLVRHKTLHFFGPDGRRSDFTPMRWLPAPLHLLRPLLRLKFLSLADKWSIARAMLRLASAEATRVTSEKTILRWLTEQRQSEASIERFWKVVLVSALAESLEHTSLAAARKVFLDGFLAHRDAADVLVPRVSLGVLYDDRVVAWLREHGAKIHLESTVESVYGSADRADGLRFGDGTTHTADFVVLAVPWQRVVEILPPAMKVAVDPNDSFASLPSAPISSVHLWFDRPLTGLPHAVLVGRLSQWVFARGPKDDGEHYYQVVISASHELSGRSRQSVVDDVVRDLQSAFPEAGDAKLLRWQLITDPNAVFSPRPGIETIRPSQQTPVSNLLLAGDWTRTGWPATMESAVRSGYLAAEALLVKLGRPERIIVPDLPRGWLARRF